MKALYHHATAEGSPEPHWLRHLDASTYTNLTLRLLRDDGAVLQRPNDEFRMANGFQLRHSNFSLRNSSRSSTNDDLSFDLERIDIRTREAHESNSSVAFNDPSGFGVRQSSLILTPKSLR
jgi:hypothetical protein